MVPNAENFHFTPVSAMNHHRAVRAKILSCAPADDLPGRSNSLAIVYWTVVTPPSTPPKPLSPGSL